MEKIKAKPRDDCVVDGIWLDVKGQTGWKLTEKTKKYDIWTKLSKEQYEQYVPESMRNNNGQ